MSSPLLVSAAPLAASGGGGGIGGILPLLVIGVGFYFLVIRPQRRRAAAVRATLENLQPGRRVMTTGGMFATVVAMDEAEVELEIAPGVRTRWAKGAVARVVDDPAAADPGHEQLPGPHAE